MANLQEQMVLQISADLSNVSRAIKQLGGDLSTMQKQIATLFQKLGAEGEKASNKIAGASNRAKQTMIQNARQIADASIHEQERAAAFAANNARNLSFQINDILSALATGQGMRGVAQQFGQIAQSFSGTGLMATLRGLLSASNLITIALTAAGSAAAYFFTQAEEKADKLSDTLEDLVKQFEDLTGQEQKTGPLQELAFDIRIEDAIAKVEASLDKLRERASKEIIEVDIEAKLPEVDFGALFGQEVGRSIQEKMENALLVINDEGSTAAQRLEVINNLIAELDERDLQKPGQGIAEMADVFRDMLPLLTRIVDREKAVQVLMDAIGKSSLEAKTKQEAFNKAIEEMMKIAEPTMTEFDRLWKAYREAVQAAAGDVEKLHQAQNGLLAGLDQIQQQSIDTWGEQSDLDTYAKKVAKVESGGDPNAKNKLSTASGLFQFIDDTFLRLAKTMNEFAGMSDAQIMGMKNNVNAQKVVFDEFTRRNEAVLRAHGIEITDATRYLAHFLGAQGAADILSGKRGPTQKEIAANPFLAGMGPQDIVKWAQRKMGEAQAGLTTEDVKEQNDALREQVEIRGENNAGIDEQVAKEEAQLKLAELLAEKEKQAREDFAAGKRESAELTQQEIDALKEQADEYGRIQGMKEAAKDFESAEARIQALRDENEQLRLQAEQNGYTLESVSALLDEKERQAALDLAQVETMKQIQQLKAQEVPLTEAQTAAIRNLNEANALADAGLKKFGETNKKVAKEQEQYSQQMAGIFKSAIGGFISDLRNGVDAGEAFANMLDRIIDGLINMALEMLFSKQALGGLFGGGGTGGGGGLLSLIFGYKKGGLAGFDGEPGLIPTKKLKHARHFQSGGWASGIPAVLHPGELVLPRLAVMGLGKGNGGGGNVDNSQVSMGDVNIDMNSGFVAADNDKGRRFGEQIRTLIQGELVRESRPGGLLRRVPA